MREVASAKTMKRRHRPAYSASALVSGRLGVANSGGAGGGKFVSTAAEWMLMEADLEGPVNFVRKPMPDRSLDCALLAQCAAS